MIQAVLAQVPQAFQYQAIARDAEGTPLSEQTIAIRLSVIPGSETEDAVYSETHTLETGSFGLVTLNVGEGEVVSGDFSSIDWSSTPMYIKIEMDASGGSDFVDMGTSQLLSVPYALYAPSAITGTGSAGNLAYWTDMSTLGDMPYILYSADESLQVSSREDAGDDDPIFEVRNREGKVIFGVYQTGVRIYVEETEEGKGSRAGFAVGGFSQSKQDEVEYLRIDPGSVRITIEEDKSEEKGSRAGFAVGGFTAEKEGETLEFLRVTHDSVRIYVSDDETKGSRAGFAVGGFTSQKQGISQEFLRVTPDSVRIYINEDQGKGMRGGFAVGGYNSTTKTEPSPYLQLDPFNYFIGHNAGYSNTSGVHNLFTGYEAGYKNTTGNNNLFQGYLSGYNNTSGEANIFIGQEAGYHNTTGTLNSFIGFQSGYEADTGNYNTFLGFWSGYHNSGGHLNTYLGAHAGHFGIDGELNTIVGSYAGAEKNFGSHNTLVGMSAGRNTEGERNTYIGSQSGSNNDTGDGNIFIGFYSGEGSAGSSNIYLGNNAGRQAPGDNNIFIGTDAGASSKGSNRLFIDISDADSSQALIYGEMDNRILRFNGLVGIGVIPESNLHVGGEMIIEGDIRVNGINLPHSFEPDEIFKTEGNYITFGHESVSEDYIGYMNNTFYFLDSPDGGDEADPDIWLGGDLHIAEGSIAIGQPDDPTEKIDVDGSARFRMVGSAEQAYDLGITADGTLTTSTSDERLKTNLAALDNALMKVLKMNAYTFNWKSKSKGPRDVGFLAGEMKAVFPEAVFKNPVDGYLGINYSRLPALLVEAVKEQQMMIESRDEEIRDLKARLEKLEEMLGIE